MYEIITSGKSKGEAKSKSVLAEILLTQDVVSAHTAIKIINAMGGIWVRKVAESEDKECENFD